MSDKENKHPCPYQFDGQCTVIRNWWNGRPSPCQHTPAELRSQEGGCSCYPGELKRIDGQRIHPGNTRPLGDIARIRKP